MIITPIIMILIVLLTIIAIIMMIAIIASKESIATYQYTKSGKFLFVHLYFVFLIHEKLQKVLLILLQFVELLGLLHRCCLCFDHRFLAVDVFPPESLDRGETFRQAIFEILRLVLILVQFLIVRSSGGCNVIRRLLGMICVLVRRETRLSGSQNDVLILQVADGRAELLQLVLRRGNGYSVCSLVN